MVYMTKQFQNNIKVLFVCHDNILKSPGKACIINGFMADKGVYYTIFERVLMRQEKQVKI